MLYQATLIGGEGNRTLQWTDPENGETLRDSPSLLAAKLLHRLGERTGKVSSAGINGMHYWTVDGEISLRDLGAEAGVLGGLRGPHRPWRAAQRMRGNSGRQVDEPTAILPRR